MPDPEWAELLKWVRMTLESAHTWRDCVADPGPDSEEATDAAFSMRTDLAPLLTIRVDHGFAKGHQWDRFVRKHPRIAAGLDQLALAAWAAWHAAERYDTSSWAWIDDLARAGRTLEGAIDDVPAEGWIIGSKPDLCEACDVARKYSRYLEGRQEKGELILERIGAQKWKIKLADAAAHREAAARFKEQEAARRKVKTDRRAAKKSRREES